MQNLGQQYTIDNSKSMNSLRLKFTYAFSAAGTMAPIFISVLGLTERELPEDVQIALKIEGLSVVDGGVTVGIIQCGFLQAADLTRTFKIMKRLQESVSCIHVPSTNNPLKRIMISNFEQLTRCGRLGLKPIKKTQSLTSYQASLK